MSGKHSQPGQAAGAQQPGSQPEQQPEHSMEEYLNRELLRFTTAGSVDDGKSTLIGRLLYDSKAIFQDQMEQLEASSRLRGEEEVNLALLTDGLRAEREQGITIDVAYRYFSTPRRKFIIADTPGHEQYTRNMVTGASTADLAIVLIDARKGVLTQSRRHGIIASLLGIPHLVVAVNKMDLVDWSQEVFDGIVRDYTEFCDNLSIDDIVFIPISALTGDNVVDRSSNMDWYEGRSVLHHLETVTLAGDRNLEDFRFPVQYVIRPHLDFRGFAGRIASGVVRRGDAVITLPSKRESRVQSIVTGDGELDEAFEGQSVVLTLEHEIDISRGDMIVKQDNRPQTAQQLEATLCWMDDSKGLSSENHYIMRHTTRSIQVMVNRVKYRIDVNSLEHVESPSLMLNEIGVVELECATSLHFDNYLRNRQTGSFVLIDPASNLTVAAGMIRQPVSAEAGESGRSGPDMDAVGGTSARAAGAVPGTAARAPGVAPGTAARSTSPNVRAEAFAVSRRDREKRNGHSAHVLWLTGLSGSGKSTVARLLEQRLFDAGRQVMVLDGDNLRHGLNGDLGFSEADRVENIRRVGHVARLLFEGGFIVICTFISPLRSMRDGVRSLLPEGCFSEALMRVSLDEARRRDPKGLYEKADAGEIRDFTGVHQPYEESPAPELVLDTERLEPEAAAAMILDYLNPYL